MVKQSQASIVPACARREPCGVKQLTGHRLMIHLTRIRGPRQGLPVGCHHASSIGQRALRLSLGGRGSPTDRLVSVHPDHSRREPRDHWCLGSPDLLLSAHTAAPACGTTLPSVPAMDRKPNRSNQEASTARSRELPALVWPSASPKRLGHRGPRAVKRFAMSLLRLVGCIRHPNHGAQATGRTYADTLNERRGRSCSPSYPPHLHRARS
jgi:hypothetical protein